MHFDIEGKHVLIGQKAEWKQFVCLYLFNTCRIAKYVTTSGGFLTEIKII
jgi:hypothetical protein